jgi:citrate lyase subunit beta/citryl-CoA lyase
VILNLEDGVAPSQKALARSYAAVALSHLKPSSQRYIVRVNPLGEGGEEDIATIAPMMPDAIRIPKIKTLDDVKRGLKLIPSPINIHLSIETKEALHNLPSFGCEPRVEACYLGILDMLHSLSLPQSLLTIDNPTIHYLLAQFLINAKTAGMIPFSFVYQNHHDHTLFEQWCHLEKKMGLTGKGCLSPTQVEIANTVFGLDKDEKTRALEIVALFEKNIQEGISGFSHEIYGFIDEPIYKDALAYLQGHK